MQSKSAAKHQDTHQDRRMAVGRYIMNSSIVQELLVLQDAQDGGRLILEF